MIEELNQLGKNCYLVLSLHPPRLHPSILLFSMLYFRTYKLLRFYGSFHHQLDVFSKQIKYV